MAAGQDRDVAFLERQKEGKIVRAVNAEVYWDREGGFYYVYSPVSENRVLITADAHTHLEDKEVNKRIKEYQGLFGS